MGATQPATASDGVAVTVTWDDPLLRPTAEHLAKELSLPVAPLGTGEARHMLVVTRERLELRSSGTQAHGPVYVDFAGGRARHRRLHGGGRRQALARAIGLRAGEHLRVVDATAGLGRDAFVLAALGCEVVLVERSPVIAALLADGLSRAARDPEIGVWVEDRMSVVEGESVDYLQGLTGETRPDVVYLDPMYPERKKSAQVKKELRVLRDVVGSQEDPRALLEVASVAAVRRVVVKRPKGAAPLLGRRPDSHIISPNTRYDIYLV